MITSPVSLAFALVPAPFRGPLLTVGGIYAIFAFAAGRIWLF